MQINSNDEIIVLRKNELRSVICEALQAELKPKFDEIKGFMENLALKKDLPEWIRGDKQAGALLCISGKAMQARRNNGFYKEGVDFIKKSDRIVLYNTNALLNLKGKNSGD
ncbi:MAG: hypothetical protein ACTTJC_01960 [Campylobacter sp.]